MVLMTIKKVPVGKHGGEICSANYLTSFHFAVCNIMELIIGILLFI